ncbi:transposase [Streptomyces sp. NPDC001851]|uniref:transposase n=1 Tax=Streptomyces sp. NPDC001851 TaxID=3154529 RepID=UPI0033203D4A
MGDKPERLGSEASFAALAGVRPVERSSGRSGDRRRRTAGTAGHTAVRRCRSRVDEESTHLSARPRQVEYRFGRSHPAVIESRGCAGFDGTVVPSRTGV